jgi:hypothetical protein
VPSTMALDGIMKISVHQRPVSWCRGSKEPQRELLAADKRG